MGLRESKMKQIFNFILILYTLAIFTFCVFDAYFNGFNFFNSIMGIISLVITLDRHDKL